MKTTCITALSIAALLAGNVSARTWQSADGAHTMEAEFHAFKPESGLVTVIQTNGKKKSFNLKFLSEQDQKWVQQQPIPEPVAEPAEEPVSADLSQQEVGKKLTSRVLRRFSGKKFKRAKIEKAPEYYLLYFSASW